jgi:uncharacterized protein (UPF0335 family)
VDVNKEHFARRLLQYKILVEEGIVPEEMIGEIIQEIKANGYTEKEIRDVLMKRKDVRLLVHSIEERKTTPY